MRLIDADAFERAVMFSDDEDLQDVIYRLRDFPTIEVERKHGSWCVMDEPLGEHTTDLLIYCSECGYRSDNKPTNYCPNCGTDMRGSTNDEK